MAHNADQQGAGSVIEYHSIDYIPHAERHGKVWHQGPFWFAGNFVLPTLVTGFIGPSLGLSVPYCILAATLGVCLGTFFMAFHANQGPRMGLPQMIQSRAQFGSRGALLPFAATVFVYVGFLVFDVILATQGIGLFADLKIVWYPVIIAVSIVIAVIGHDLLHFVQRWLTFLLVVVFAILTIAAVIHFGLSSTELPADGGSALGWSAPGFLALFSLAAGYNISYAVYVSDYTRYLPATASAPALIASVYAGAALSAIWLMSLGSLLAANIADADPVEAIRYAGNLVFPGFGTVAVLVSVLALVSIMGVNAYGAMLTGASAVDGFREVRPTRRLRVVGLVIVGVAALIIALLIPEHYLGSFNSFVLLMLYFLIPWTAVNLADFYFVRRGRYAIADILQPGGLYGRWAWRGLVAYVAGFLAMIPFFSLSFFVGPVARLLDGGDLSFIVGLLVSAGLYLLLARGIDRGEEARAVASSQQALEGHDDGTLDVRR
ncbi:NCS1 nucleoside transporter family [Mycobacterium sp. BK558]|nr:NCS1 nucleoside transporter family [Mycobacterium sp. BK558]